MYDVQHRNEAASNKPVTNNLTFLGKQLRLFCVFNILSKASTKRHWRKGSELSRQAHVMQNTPITQREKEGEKARSKPTMHCLSIGLPACILVSRELLKEIEKTNRM